MTVRAKFECGQVQRGKVGHALFLHAVWEGSQELQRISENAIFGEASPSGTAELHGRDLGHFVQGEEYYLDFLEPTRTAALESKHLLLACPVRKIFRSEPNPSWPDMFPQFRFVLDGDRSIAGAITIAVKNPPAVAFLDDYDAFHFAVSVAIGRRSDAEIAIRQQLLDEAKANPLAATDDGWKRHVAILERKLKRAQGEE